MFVIRRNGQKFIVQYDFFNSSYTQPEVEFSTVELAEKHKESLVKNCTTASIAFIEQHWNELDCMENGKRYGQAIIR